MTTNTVQFADSLIANEFSFEIEGQSIDGVFRIAGLTTFKLDDAGKRVKPAIHISKMVQRDGNNPFNKWLRETIASKNSDQRPTRDIAIMAVDDGIETRRWTVKGAWIQEVSYSDFDDASFEMVSENYVIQYDDIDEGWSASTLE